jgi:Icc-related predicted phosphoesterase
MGEKTSSPDVVRVAAVADLHCKKSSQGTLTQLFAQISAAADILLLCGDLTDYGLPEEAEVFVRAWASGKKLPTLAVMGNHDHESGKTEEVEKILGDAGITVLDGDGCEVLGIGFVGVKGFAGGFGNRALQPWGEICIKRFVHEALDEALKLESALARLTTPQRIALLHYSPILGTVEGEPLEIVPFLGSSRLEEPLDRYPVNAAFHGHAHHGSAEGRTRGNIPVYNVAMPLLERLYPDRPPFHILELPVPAATVQQ